jgi:hypothetical protein
METKEFDYSMVAETVIEHLGSRKDVRKAVILSSDYFRLYTLKDAVERLFPDAELDMELLFGAIYENLKAIHPDILKELRAAKKHPDEATDIVNDLIFSFS